MGQSAIKNPRRIVSLPGGGGTDAALTDRVTYLEDNTYKITYYAEINATSGTITKPTGSTILTDQFASGADAYVVTIVNGRPSTSFPQTAGGTIVDVTSFDTSGNFVLTGIPSAFPCALIYILTIKAVDYQNLTTANILDIEEVNVVTQSITNGDTTHAPSGDAVFDALALKLTDSNNLSDLSSAKTARVNIGQDKQTNGGNAAYSILSTDKVVYTGTAFTAARIWTLPDASTVNAGYEIIVADYLSTVTATNTLTIAVQTGQFLNAVVNGTEVMQSGGGQRRLFSDGVSNWTFDAGVVRLSKTQTLTNKTIDAGTYSTSANLSYSTASRVLTTDASKNVVTSTVTTTTLGYLDATSSVQTQLDGKWSHYFFQSLTTSPSDATTYYFSQHSLVLNTSDVRRFNMFASGTIKAAWLNLGQGTNGSNETVTIVLRNVTTATNYTIGTFTSDFGANQGKGFSFTGLNIPIGNNTDQWSLSVVTPTWVTNPGSWNIGLTLKVLE